MAGYSGTPLVKKLGFKAGFRVLVAGAPSDYRSWLEPLPEDLALSSRLRGTVDAVHVFTTERKKLEHSLARGLTQIAPNGMIWVSWPKRAAKVKTDVTEDVVRDVALPLGLVDIKVCAVNDVWSGLKLVIRKELR